MKENKFINIIKKKWLVDSFMTVLLILIIIAIYICINIIVHKQNWSPIDFSQEKLFSLSEDS